MSAQASGSHRENSVIRRIESGVRRRKTKAKPAKVTKRKYQQKYRRKSASGVAGKEEKASAIGGVIKRSAAASGWRWLLAWRHQPASSLLPARQHRAACCGALSHAREISGGAVGNG
jgi:hypothetical protein